MIFDTHQFIKRMTDAGFTPTQAEALSEEQINLINNNLATKQDVVQIRQDIEKWKLEMKLFISEGVEKNIKWTLAAVTLAVTLSSVVIGLLIHFS